MYIDDQRILHQNVRDCASAHNLAIHCFKSAGWIVNESKSSSEPSQRLKFLGLINSSVDMKYYLPVDKLESIRNLLIEVLKLKRVHIKKLASLVGKLQFAFKAVGPSVRLLTRSAYYLISKASSWNCMIILNDLAIKEFSYLRDNLYDLNGFPIRPKLSTEVIDIKVASDSSEIGTCVYKVCKDNTLLHKRAFSESESKLNSTVREIMAFFDFYTSDKANFLSNQNIVHYTDSHNCATILSIGSRNKVLQPLVLDIFLAWKRLNLVVNVIYLSRNDPIIQVADDYSRDFDIHDYSLSYDNFVALENIFFKFEIDCFATKDNFKCAKYFSKFEDNNAFGRNFFAQKLPAVNLFVFPPTHLIIPTLYHLEKFKANGVLIIPKWASAIFWNLICQDGIHYNYFIKSYFEFSPVFVSGEHIVNQMFNGVKKFSTLAIHFNFFESFMNVNFKSCVAKDWCSLGGCAMCI